MVVVGPNSTFLDTLKGILGGWDGSLEDVVRVPMKGQRSGDGTCSVLAVSHLAQIVQAGGLPERWREPLKQLHLRRRAIAILEGNKWFNF